MARASEEKLAGLHDKLCDTLSTMIEVRTVKQMDKDGEVHEVALDPSPAALAVAAKFLKDNNITATPDQSNRLGEVADQLAARRAKRKVNLKTDMPRAMAEVAKGAFGVA